MKNIYVGGSGGGGGNGGCANEVNARVQQQASRVFIIIVMLMPKRSILMT